MVCDQCGQPHARCKGHNRAGKPCGRNKLAGQNVCDLHGGKAPQALAAAERRLQERAAVLALESFGVPIEVDAHTALLQELHRTAGAVQWLGAIVADLNREDLVWGTTKVKDGGDDRGTTQEAKPNIWYELWLRERKHLVEVGKACHAAGIEEHRVELETRQAQVVVATFERALGRMALSDEQRHEFKVIAAEEFLAIESGGGAG